MVDMNIAIYKAQIIIYGIDFQSYSFNCYEQDYKLKKKYLKPAIEQKRVFDISGITDMIPSEIIIDIDGERSLVKTRHNSLSPIKAIWDGEVLKLCFMDGQLQCNAELVPKLKVLDEKIIINNDIYYVKDFLSIVGMDRISVLLFDGCSNWNIGNPCKFCDMHPKPITQRVVIPSVNELYGCSLDMEEWWKKGKDVFFEGLAEAYKRVIASEGVGPHYHNFIMAGSLPDASYTWQLAYELLVKINEVMVGEIILNLQPHTDKKILELFKNIGVTKIQYNIEVFGEKKYRTICPDKLPYDLLIERLKEAVEVFGRGNVRSNFVLGIQPIEEIHKGIEMLAQLGVVPDYSIFQPKKNTPFENHETAKLTEVLECSEHLCQIYNQYGYKPIFCKLSSRSSIMNEMYDTYEKNN